jgi:hypothetical protein
MTKISSSLDMHSEDAYLVKVSRGRARAGYLVKNARRDRASLVDAVRAVASRRYDTCSHRRRESRANGNSARKSEHMPATARCTQMLTERVRDVLRNCASIAGGFSALLKLGREAVHSGLPKTGDTLQASASIEKLGLFKHPVRLRRTSTLKLGLLNK